MTRKSNSRRQFLATGLSMGAVGATMGRAVGQEGGSRSLAAVAAEDRPETRGPEHSVRYCLNVSTINNSKVPVREQLQIASQVGYDSVELWLRDIQKFTSEGGQLSDLAKEIKDLGLAVDSAIAFGQWIVDDDQKRKEGLEQCRKDMEIVSTLGGTHIAAPPTGATKEAGLDLNAAADRYRDLIAVGRQFGVWPQIELWGFSANLSSLAEVLYVAAAAQDENACLLLDVYHMYKGGCDFSNIDLVPAQKLTCLHMNDYPDMDRASISDKDRVYPGDGIAPMNKILQTLFANNFGGTLSLELFNRDYWKLPAEEVATTGLRKMKECVERALA